MKARALINSHSHEAALGMLDRLLAVNSTDFINAHVAYDRRIFSEFALDLKGVALLRLGRFGQASVEFNKGASGFRKRPPTIPGEGGRCGDKGKREAFVLRRIVFGRPAWVPLAAMFVVEGHQPIL
jgi:hypothetical protein